ncbi:putative L-ascorbate peroxidase 6 [Haematococcus lacustris]
MLARVPVNIPVTLGRRKCGNAPRSPVAAATSDLGKEVETSRRQLLLGTGLLAIAPGLLTASSSHASIPGPRLPSAAEQAALDGALRPIITKGKAAVALRLIFHDCGTFQSSAANGGANASIRFELDRPENGGLKRGWRLIETVAKGLSGTAAAGVSQADLVALCGARAVAVCGGPQVQVRLGRQDASGPDPEGRLPGEQLTSQQLKDVFSAKGFSSREFLALCGAHTLGSKGFGDPTTFDNVYFKELLRKPWLDTKDSMAAMIGLPSDHVLPDDPELLPMIQAYADDQALFFNDFQLAFQKLSELGTGWDA